MSKNLSVLVIDRTLLTTGQLAWLDGLAHFRGDGPAPGPIHRTCTEAEELLLSWSRHIAGVDGSCVGAAGGEIGNGQGDDSGGGDTDKSEPPGKWTQVFRCTNTEERQLESGATVCHTTLREVDPHLPLPGQQDLFAMQINQRMHIVTTGGLDVGRHYAMTLRLAEDEQVREAAARKCRRDRSG